MDLNNWPAQFDKEFVETDEDGSHIYESGDIKGIKAFIQSLIDQQKAELLDQIECLLFPPIEGKDENPPEPEV